MNQDIPKLRGVLYAMKEMKSIEDRLEWQMERRYRCTSGYSSGMPGGGASAGKEDELAALEELEAAQRAALEAYATSALEVEQILARINDDRIRLFVRLFYVENAYVEDILRACKWSLRTMRNTQKRVSEAENMASLTNN